MTEILGPAVFKVVSREGLKRLIFVKKEFKKNNNPRQNIQLLLFSIKLNKLVPDSGPSGVRREGTMEYLADIQF